MRLSLPVAPLLTACTLAVMLAAPAGAARFDLDPTAEPDTVSFRSTASLEFIEGKTGNIEGGFDFNPDDPSAVSSGLLRVDLRTLRTGIDLRDQHMRERHLETDEYPYAYFEFDRLENVPSIIQTDVPIVAAATGWFFIHGVKRPLKADLEFSLHTSELGDTSLNATVHFAIDLEDYKIKRPKALFLKLAETIEVEVVFQARTNREQVEIALPEWAESD